MSETPQSGDVVTIFDLPGYGTSVCFSCPGCGENHMLPVNRWQWNGSKASPTLSPSILMKTSRLTKLGREQYLEMTKNGRYFERLDSEDVVCHSFVREGRIEFLSDCTHSMAGQTVPMSAVA